MNLCAGNAVTTARGLFVFVLACSGMPRTATAVTFVVTSSVDAIDATPGDGVCASFGGQCTLRAAVQEANATPGADVIDLPAGTYVLAITGRGENAAATGDLDVTDELSVRGASRDTSIIDAASIDRIFDTTVSARLALSDVTIRQGNAMLENRAGGAIFARADLDLMTCRILDSTATNAGAVLTVPPASFAARGCEFGGNTAESAGGALWPGGPAQVTDSTFVDNRAGNEAGAVELAAAGPVVVASCQFLRNIAENRGGALFVASSVVSIDNCLFEDNQAWQNGGAIYAQDSLTVTSSRFTGNRAGFGAVIGGIGGAVHVSYGDPFTFLDCVFTGNAAQFDGGAIAMYRAANVSLGRVTIDSCNADRFGGAIAIGSDNVFTDSTLRAFDSTFSANSAAVGGGAISIDWGRIGPQATLVNCTLSANTAPQGGAIQLGVSLGGIVEGRLRLFGTTIAGNNSAGGALSFEDTSQLEMAGSILSGTIGGDDCVGLGSLTSLGFNIIEAPGTCVFTGATSDDVIGLDPLLGPLQDNGGPTFTRALLAGSPAIDLNAPCLDDAGAVLVADQRGQSRPIDGDRDGVVTCDAGAFEAGCAADTDGDTLGDDCDCAPADANVLRIPDEADLRVAKDPATEDALLTWTDFTARAGSATSSEVASDTIAQLWLRRVADAACVATGLGSTWSDSRPIVGMGWYYLARGVNSCGPPRGEGWGADSRGVPRPACP